MAFRRARRLASSTSSSSSYMDAALPSNDSFAFDGTNSDLAQQLYYRAKANESMDKLLLRSVPDAVLSRLADLGLDWSKLPGIAQHALLWDSGFGFTSQNDAVQIWTLGGHSLTDLAVTLDEFHGVGCVDMNCTEPDGAVSYASYQCNGAQMLKAARCVVAEFADDNTYNAAMWATGGNPNAVPMPRVARHWWTDTGSNISYVVTAVHTLALDDEPAYDNCAVPTQNGGYGSLVLPCHTKANISAAIEKDMQTVEGSPWVSRWLVEDYPDAAVTASTEDSEGFSLVLLVPIIGGVLAFTALLLIGVCCRRKRRERARKVFEQSTSSQHTLLTSPIERSEQRHPPVRPTVTVSDDTTTDTYIGGDQTIQIPPGYREDYSNRGSNAPFKLLLTSEYLTGKRIAFDSLVFVKALSSGSSGEVWLCDYADQQVACKRLLHSKGQKAEDVHDFVQEIELNASLQHPNIGAFIGVAWSSLDNLEMVIEYFPMGDLQRYLQKNFDLLSWAKDKIHMAIGVAQALGYLHSRTPPLIHRDLKSKNIMLTRQLEPKLIDFGVSRGRMDSTMTAGVGTPYWTAPEILEGKHYTEQADIYSFGVVLSELDTCKIPFHNFLSTGGTNVKPFQILQEVMTGTLRPSFSEECPPRIRRVGVACCQQDAARRPTAAQLVRMLQSSSLQHHSNLKF